MSQKSRCSRLPLDKITELVHWAVWLEQCRYQFVIYNQQFDSVYSSITTIFRAPETMAIRDQLPSGRHRDTSVCLHSYHSLPAAGMIGSVIQLT
jgi:hypothetical protein